MEKKHVRHFVEDSGSVLGQHHQCQVTWPEVALLWGKEKGAMSLWDLPPESTANSNWGTFYKTPTQDSSRVSRLGETVTDGRRLWKVRLHAARGPWLDPEAERAWVGRPGQGARCAASSAALCHVPHLLSMDHCAKVMDHVCVTGKAGDRNAQGAISATLL